MRRLQPRLAAGPGISGAAAEKAGVPVFQTPLVTMKFINAATLALETMFAPRGTEMGSMVDILGVGVLIRGESGIGKSEAVLALIERGYSLVSDDVTRVTLRGRARSRRHQRRIDARPHGNPRHRHHQRRRHVRRQKHPPGKKPRSGRHAQGLERGAATWTGSGMEQEFVKVLGVDIPHIVIPVRPGRDLARLIEVAAFQTKLKMSGYNAAQELNDRLIAHMSPGNPPPAK